MIRKITFILYLLVTYSVYSQVGIGTNTPSNNAALELTSNSKGVLITRIPLTATNSPTPLSAHVAGMIVYNTATASSGATLVKPGFYYNNGSEWIKLEPTPVVIGDIKESFSTADHDGWYLLDGRSKSALSATAQNNATAIGFGANIPNAADKFLKGKASAESLMAVGGSNSVVLTQSNLPNVVFNGTSNLTGAHTHNYDDKVHSVPENLNVVTSLLGILSGIGLVILNNSVGSDTVSTATSTSATSGNHTHTATVNTGGTNTPIEKISHLVANTFVYLGK